ncbi:MAG: IS110 family transposase [Flavobacteriales bacterium]
MKRQCVGIDIANSDFKAAVAKRGADDGLSCTASKKFDNTRSGFNQLVRWAASELDKDTPVVFLMEATGVYHEELAHHLHRIGKQVHVVLPNKFKHFAASLNMKSKTDAIDAKLLARFGVEREHRPWIPADPVLKQMRHLSRYRVQLQVQKTAISNILHSKDHSHGVPAEILKSSKKVIAFLDKEIKKLNKEMEKVVKSDPEIEAKVNKLCTIPGCGITTVTAIVAETGGFQVFESAKQLTSYAGYDIVHNESGTSVLSKTRISKKGNRYIRHHMYLPAMSASRHIPEFNALKERVKDRTKIPMKAQVAIQRKLLILMYTLWKNDAVYEKEHHQKKVARDKAQATQDSALEQLPLEVER